MAQHPPRRRLIRVRGTVDALGARVTHVQVRLPFFHCYIRSWRSADGRLGRIQLEPPLRRTPQASPTGQARWVSWIYGGLMLVNAAVALFRLLSGDMVALAMLGVLTLLMVGSFALDRGRLRRAQRLW